MEQENNDETNTIDNNLDDMIKVLRDERDNIMKKEAENEILLNGVQRNAEANNVELNNVSKLKSELELQHNQRVNFVENEIETKINLESDIEHIKKVTEIFDRDLKHLKSDLESIEIRTKNMEEIKTQMNKEFQTFHDEKNLNKKHFMNEINILEALIKAEISNKNEVLEKYKLTSDKQGEELEMFTINEQKLKVILEQKLNKNSEILNDIEKRKTEKEYYRSEYAKLKEKSSEFIEKHNSTAASYVENIATLEENNEKYNKRSEEMKNKIDLLKIEHQKQEEEISLQQVSLQNLESEQCSAEETLTTQCSKLEELKIKLSSLKEEKKSEIELLHGHLNCRIESNGTLKQTVADLQQTLATKMEAVGTLKEKIKEETEQKESLLQQYEETELRIKEETLECENEVKQYTDQINDWKCRQAENKSVNENLKNIVEDKLERIKEKENQLQIARDEKTAIFEEKNVVLNKVYEDLKVEKQRREALNSKSLKLTKSVSGEIEQTEKNYKDHIATIEKERNQFEEKMDSIMKNENDKYIKERKSFEDSIKTKLLQISEYRTAKDNLQQELSKKFSEILVIAHQIEEKKEEEKRSFKSPIPPKPKQTRKSKTSMPVTSTPKKIQKKTVTEEKHTDISAIDDNFPLTQKENKKNESADKPEEKLPKYNETADAGYESYKNISSAQTPCKLKPKKLDFSDSPIKSEKPETFEPFTQLKDKSSIWPSDLDTSDDGFRKNPVISQIKPKIEKPQTRYTEPSKPQFKDKCNLWPTDLETSEDNMRRKTSQIKSSVTTEKSTKHVETINTQTKNKTNMWPTDNDSSDEGFPRNVVTSTQRKVRSPLTQKKSVYDFSDDSPIDVFDSLKSSNVTSTKKPEVDDSKSFTLRKRPTVNYAMEGDSSDDIFFGKMDKSKKIQSNLKSSTNAQVINIDTSFSE